MNDERPQGSPERISRILPEVLNTTKYTGIETTYRGVEMRSRLEARWAAFFDQCGWRWNYEPFDMAGWIPDFTLGPKSILVEIKPFHNLEQWGPEIEKIKRANPRQPVALFGESPTLWIDEQGDEAPECGWLLDWHGGEHDGECYYHGAPWRLNFGFTEGNDELGLCSLDGGWWNLIWTPPEDYHHPNKWSRVHLQKYEVEKELVERWSFACNLTKWKPTNGHRYR